MTSIPMAEAVYILCAVMSVICASMLARAYLHSRSHLLLWSSLCFVGLAMNNILLFVSMMVLPTAEIDWPFWRTLITAGSGSCLLFGLIWEVT